jgi:hypothetical protein
MSKSIWKKRMKLENFVDLIFGVFAGLAMGYILWL